MFRKFGIGRDKTAAPRASREPLDDYFENLRMERKPTVAGRYLDRLHARP